ncbi:MAG TPA: efflux RND transporter periplasmic adaptor subunit [Steroidobacteraceae bacterium]|nr:efflux RND transporter periplasmic adaptor subunit [Steroidobacteraceae bacterium]
MPLDQQSLDALRMPRSDDASRSRSFSGPSRRYLWLGAVALVIVALLSVLLLRGGEATEVQTASARAVQGSSQAAVLNASGYVVARRLATVSSKVTGKIDEVLIEEGASVQAGQVLARLDPTTARAQHQLASKQLDAARSALQEVRVRLAEAERALVRTRKVREQNLVSETALDEAESEVKALQARLTALEGDVAVAASGLELRQRDLDDLVIRAPFTGVVISKDAQPGEMVSPISAGGGYTRTGIATIVDMDSREIEVDVNEAFINRVRAGQRVEAVLDAYADLVLPARVINIVPTADRQKATVRVRIGFDQLDARILPDMGVKVRFLEEGPQPAADAPRALALIPTSAIASADGKSYVWIVNDDVVERRAVSTGRERGEEIEVVAGLRAGDVVVAPAVEGLKDGDKVKLKAS